MIIRKWIIRKRSEKKIEEIGINLKFYGKIE